MLDHVLAYLRNWFVVGHYDGNITIENGEIKNVSLLDGQYFKIVGSILNDGTYKFPAFTLKDEQFNGSVYALAIPPDLLDLVQEIEGWQEKNGTAASGLYQSESFGGYSYTIKNGADSSGGFAWQNAFATRLNRWRKI